jgi:hypothetical protein
VFHESIYLDHLVARVLPVPRRFRLAWKETRGSSPLYVWAPDPPDDAFVGLGMLATTSPEPPPPDSARCVPRTWCEAVEAEAMERLWQDDRAGGLWRLRQTGLLVAAKSSTGPQAGSCYQLRRDLVGSEVRLVDWLPDEAKVQVT